MHPKLNPFLLLGILCVTFAISLGGIPPSAVDEDTSSSISFGPLLRGVGGPLEAKKLLTPLMAVLNLRLIKKSP